MEQGKKMMHVGIRAGEIGGYVLLPSSPERAEMIAACLDHAQEVAYNREYRTFTGMLAGERVSVTSTGMGGPSVGIAVEELRECGAHTMIRVGTCESASPRVKAGQLVLPNGAVRMEGVARHYLPEEYPAVPDMDVLDCLREAAEASQESAHIGIVITKACFSTQYPAPGRPMSRILREKWSAYVDGGALCGEMGCAPMFIIGGTLRIRTAAVLGVSCDDGQYSDDLADWPEDCEKRAIRTAVEGLRRLIEKDKGEKHQ